jgi:small subunit ribosomal protein S20
LANIQQAKKRFIQSIYKRQRNNARRSIIRTLIKQTIILINLRNIDKARKQFLKLEIILDRYSTKGLIHKNKAARHKRRLLFKIKQIK